MDLTEKSDEQVLKILAWPQDYRVSMIEKAREEVYRRRMHKTKSKKRMKAYVESRIQEEMRGYSGFSQPIDVPPSLLFSRKEMEAMIKKRFGREL